MNKNSSIIIRHVLDRKTTMISIYLDNFLLTSNHLSILDILKEILGWKYSIKYFGEIQTIIKWQII